MHAWESIQKSVDYIEENLACDIQMEELASIAALSPFYFQRLFNRLVKKPVREYIKLRRLARACKGLEIAGSRVVDVAFGSGFNSHETFSRAFKSAYGMTPAEYRENPVPLNSFNKPDLLLNYIMVDEGVPLVSDGIVLEMNRRDLDHPLYFRGIVGHVLKSSHIPLGRVTGVSDAGAVWERFQQEEGKINRKPGGRGFGVSFIGDAPKGYFSYFAGAEVEEGAGNPEPDQNCHYRLWKLPAQKYIVCGFEAESFEELVCNALGKAMNYMFSWLKRHDLEPISFMTEHYYMDTPEAFYMEIWQPIMA